MLNHEQRPKNLGKQNTCFIIEYIEANWPEFKLDSHVSSTSVCLI